MEGFIQGIFALFKEERGIQMIFEDDDGKIWMPEEVDELSIWEIDDRKIRVCEED